VKPTALIVASLGFGVAALDVLNLQALYIQQMWTTSGRNLNMRTTMT